MAALRALHVFPTQLSQGRTIPQTKTCQNEIVAPPIGDFFPALGVRDGLPVGVLDSLVLEEDKVDGEGEGDGVSETVEDGEGLCAR